jgi:putative methyltransferase (TIGR04325 family)
VRTLAENLLSEGRLGRVLRFVPGCESAYWRFFRSERGGNNFQYGYYRSHAAAAAAIPAPARSGWNNDASARHYIDSTTQPSSFAVLFWLYRCLERGMHVIDLGGGVGQMYRSFVQRADLPGDVRWTVVDVAAAVERGRQNLKSDPSPGLAFETDLAALEVADILHCSGALQFVGDVRPSFFDSLRALPHWIIVNKVVLSPRPTFWTLHNIGTGICTYQIFNEAAFLAAFAQRGYVLRERWRVAEMGMMIPFHPEGYVRYASGFCFELGGAERAALRASDDW